MIQHSMVTKSIERAQKKVEENNFGIRKRLLEYDDVMNIQREAIYKKRANALSGERLSVDLNNMFQAITSNRWPTTGKAATTTPSAGTPAEIGIDPEMDAADFAEGRIEELSDRCFHQFREFYDRKSHFTSDALLPIVENVHKNEGHRYKRIAIPFTDGRSKMLPISADIELAIKTKGRSIMADIEKAVTLSIIDENGRSTSARWTS
ncbi:MAG: hypothetical protein IPG32_21500 [Saprospirales bacterium]|nr:hypothetical protein [Saprospirales bacterium]